MEAATKELPPRAQKLLGIIRQWSGDWLSKADIVKMLNVESETRQSKYLSHADTAYLEMLDLLGFIEAVKEDTTHSPLGRWKYRAIRREAVEQPD